MTRLQLFNRLSLFGTVLTLIVVILGAFVRLSDAGLGCPDWPGCYGVLTVPQSEEQIGYALEGWDDTPLARGDEAWVAKAWKEMVHRYVAGLLGLLILGLAVMAWINRRDPDQPVKLPWLLLALVIFQSALGMWTVTLLVKPAIVLAHLLGGLATLSLIWLQYLRTRDKGKPKEVADIPPTRFKRLRQLGMVAFVVLIAQIALGGWVSTNYAALACPDFPTCHGQYWPDMDFEDGFTLWRELGKNYEYGVLDNQARTAIHYTHRLGAIAALLAIGAFVAFLWAWGQRIMRRMAYVVAGLLTVQLLIGVTVVIFSLPLWLATAHNAGAALLTLAMVTALWTLYGRRP
ncbi:cytochrome c oxidase assembly protein subunit 15 [Natronospira proteinivora]|uniref:Cytochrome c oxidase assembly protein subunit 15 n=1 Tax=Natronospira proteinivora TaxID=1807133 RepID=A0ABT1GAL0_9GAMM|nr:COX15/CtaA family protein [Natronospira proteinivora]MCP1727945.1 cytochrome c oxidase assembly protein subunit 15 [Natronospira proteinivora]